MIPGSGDHARSIPGRSSPQREARRGPDSSLDDSGPAESQAKSSPGSGIPSAAVRTGQVLMEKHAGVRT